MLLHYSLAIFCKAMRGFVMLFFSILFTEKSKQLILTIYVPKYNCQTNYIDFKQSWN